MGVVVVSILTRGLTVGLTGKKISVVVLVVDHVARLMVAESVTVTHFVICAKGDAMTDKDRLQAMRALGVRWPYGRCIPTYPASMTDTQKAKADKLYDAMSNEFVRWMSGRED